MDEPANQIEGGTDNLLLRRFVLEQNEAAYVQLCKNLRPRLLAALKSRFTTLSEHCHQDIVQDVFIKLHTQPEKAWNPNTGKPSNAFSILCRHATNLALDIVRKANRVNVVGLDEIAENLSTEPLGKSASQSPSEDEMEKVIKNAGLNDPLVADLKNPEIWPDGNAKPNYQLLAERHQITVKNVQQRVSRYRKQVLKRFGSKAGFLSVAMSTLARFKPNFPSILAWSFVLASILAIFFLLRRTTPNASNPIAGQNVSATESTITETNAEANIAKQNLDATNSTSATNNSLSQVGLIPSGRNAAITSNLLAVHASAHFAGIPEKVQLAYEDTDLENAKMTQLEKLLTNDSVKCELYPTKGFYRYSECEVRYFASTNAWPDGLECAKYVQNILMQAFPDHSQRIKIVGLAFFNSESGLRTVNVAIPPDF